MTHIHGSHHIGHGLFAGLVSSLGLGPAFDHWHHTHHGFWDPFVGWLWNENSDVHDLHHASGSTLWSLPTSHQEVDLVSYSTPMAAPEVDLTAIPIGGGYTVGALFLLAFVAVVLIATVMLARKAAVVLSDRRIAKMSIQSAELADADPLAATG